MATKIYKTFAKIFGIILVLVGIGALIGANFASSFIASQMEEQNITFPDEEAIQSQVDIGRISEEDAAALRPFAGTKMTDGAGAKVWADNYIASHMKFIAAQTGAEDATYATAGSLANEQKAALIERLKADNPGDSDELIEKKAQAEIQDPLTDYEEAAKARVFQDLRTDTLLTGDTLRGMLLNVYGWSLIGKIALYVGIGALVIGALLTIWGFVPPKKAATVKAE